MHVHIYPGTYILQVPGYNFIIMVIHAILLLVKIHVQHSTALHILYIMYSTTWQQFKVIHLLIKFIFIDLDLHHVIIINTDHSMTTEYITSYTCTVSVLSEICLFRWSKEIGSCCRWYIKYLMISTTSFPLTFDSSPSSNSKSCVIKAFLNLPPLFAMI